MTSNLKKSTLVGLKQFCIGNKNLLLTHNQHNKLELSMKESTMVKVFDKSGNLYKLEKYIYSGGEGKIYKHGNLCFKIYHKHNITFEREEKVKVMIENPPQDYTWSQYKHRSFSWPNKIVFDHNQNFIGYAMPFIDRKILHESHDFYSHASRHQKYGKEFSWEYLLRACMNFTYIVKSLHSKKHCLGDIRESNILVSPKAFVTIVDCDSFQIKSPTGKIFYTRVGVGEYLPPEFSNNNFTNKDIDRYYSDLFGLGILIFRFLMDGYHPFSGRGSSLGQLTLNEKIKKGIFPYDDLRLFHSNVIPPKGAPSYSIIPINLKQLFRRCFVDGHSIPYKRPSAKEWHNELINVSKRIIKCNKSINHVYPSHLNNCPWCINHPKIFPNIAIPSMAIPSTFNKSISKTIKESKPKKEPTIAWPNIAGKNRGIDNQFKLSNEKSFNIILKNSRYEEQLYGKHIKIINKKIELDGIYHSQMQEKIFIKVLKNTRPSLITDESVTINGCIYGNIKAGKSVISANVYVSSSSQKNNSNIEIYGDLSYVETNGSVKVNGRVYGSVSAGKGNITVGKVSNDSLNYIGKVEKKIDWHSIIKSLLE